MKILLSATGTRGDVQPLLMLAKTLQQDGHQVTVCVSQDFRDWAEKLELPCIVFDIDMAKEQQAFGSGIRAVLPLMNWLKDNVRKQFNVLMKNGEDFDILIAGLTEFSAPSIAERFNIPLYWAMYAPMQTSTTYPPAIMPMPSLPKWANKQIWRVFKLGGEMLFKNTLNIQRQQIGMDQIQDFNQYLFGKSHTLFCVSEHLMPACPSWDNGSFSITGYNLLDSPEKLPLEVVDFIQRGSKPIYIGFGSMQHDDREYISHTIVDAIHASGCRAVVGKGWSQLGSPIQSDNILFVDDINHTALFPQMAAIIHHGGCGTTHTASWSGAPQLVVPHLGDQYFWGQQVFKRQLGPSPIPIKKLNRNNLAEAISSLLQTPKYLQAAEDLGQDMQGMNGTRYISNLLRDKHDTQQQKTSIRTPENNVAA